MRMAGTGQSGLPRDRSSERGRRSAVGRWCAPVLAAADRPPVRFLAQGRVAQVEENTAADGIEPSAAQIERLDNLASAAGERHDQGNMAVIDR
jgi:hypothetical protein